VAGHPALEKGKASEGRLKGTALKGAWLADLLAGVKAAAEVKRAETTASFMVTVSKIRVT
jgi:hypothetical protein